MAIWTDARVSHVALMCAQRLQHAQSPAHRDTNYTDCCTAGAITTLGRGGSDLSATVIGAALNLPEVQVWKDVDGERRYLSACSICANSSSWDPPLSICQTCMLWRTSGFRA